MAKTMADQSRIAGVLARLREDVRPDVPNLDGFSTEADDLEALESLYGRLACYAGHKAEAMRLRAAGDMPAAQSHERVCEEQYRRLPEWAKW